MANEKFCLRWNDFENNINIAFKELRDDKDFFDVTLACEDEQIQAHRVILSACSPFFKTILRRNPHQHPLLYLKDVSFLALQSVLNFMYHGEVNIAQEELNTFLAVAESLKVKGLTQNQSEPTKLETSAPNKQIFHSATSIPKPIKNAPKNTHTTVHTKPVQAVADKIFVNSAAVFEEEEVQEVAIKSEPKELNNPEPAFVPSSIYSNQNFQQSNNKTLATSDDTALMYTEEGYDDYGEYPEEQEQYQAVAAVATGNAEIAGETFQDPSELLQFVGKDLSSVGSSSRRYVCTICNNFYHQGKSNVRNHVECKHFPNSFIYNCDLCGNNLPSKAALQKHKHKVHRPM